MTDDAEKIGQNEIEDLLREAKGSPPASTGAAAPSTEPATLGQSEMAAGTVAPSSATSLNTTAATATGAQGSTVGVQQADIDVLLEQAQDALASVDQPGAPAAAGMKPFDLANLSGAPPSADHASLELVRDVELDLKIELGRTYMQLEDVLRLNKGSVVPLDKLAGDPVDIYVNGRLIARGEVLVLNDNFCVRIAELVAGETPQ